MLLQELKEVLKSNDNKRITYYLSHLADVFDSYNENIDEFENIIYCLLEYCVEVNDMAMKLEAMDTIEKAAIFQNIDHIDFDILYNNLEELQSESLSRAIDILGYTYNLKYIDKLICYKDHVDQDVRNSAISAISEIKGGRRSPDEDVVCPRRGTLFVSPEGDVSPVPPVT